ncbi:hypothetical protein BDZ97DRAFT_1756283 [Flammula alnicola]|nr:hypothetical protein BDZ97DRAFT_1756283 [Flammula alnicola]
MSPSSSEVVACHILSGPFTSSRLFDYLQCGCFYHGSVTRECSVYLPRPSFGKQGSFFEILTVYLDFRDRFSLADSSKLFLVLGYLEILMPYFAFRESMDVPHALKDFPNTIFRLLGIASL